MTLIRHSILTYEIDVPEADVRAALILEAMEKHGLTHEGKPIAGLSAKVTYDGRRGSGTFTIKITRDLGKSDQGRLPAPGAMR